MKIKAIQFSADGFMTQAFAFGGENKADGSPDVRYPSSLQNYLIDTGSEVILVDTGFRPDADAMKLTGDNVVRATYSDGAYHNFPESQKVADGVYFIKARGHTNGNSIVIVEADGLFYMIHGDVTYTDAALKANKLSIVLEGKIVMKLN